MDADTKLLVFAIDMICPILVGYACKYQHILREGFFNKLILNNILVVCPIVSFLSFWVLPLTSDIIWLPFISLVMGFVPGGIAYLWAQHKYSDDKERGAYVMAASLSNFGTIGGICVFLLYGERGYGYQQIILLFQYVLMFTFCYPLAQYFAARGERKRKRHGISVRSVLFSRNQIAVLGIMLGGALQYIGVSRPPACDGVAQIFIHAGAWTGLIPVGYSIDFARIRRYWFSLFDLTFIKFLVTPIIVFTVACLVITDSYMLYSILVLSCMPVAINAVVTARLYHLNIDLDVAAFIVTTILFLVVNCKCKLNTNIIKKHYQ